MIDKNIILKHVLTNSIKFEGKPNTGAVIGKVVSEIPGAKEQMQAVVKEVNSAIKEISKLSLEKQKEMLDKIDSHALDKKVIAQRVGLPEWKGAKKGEFVTRIAPSPSGPLHIGHAFVIGLIYGYKKMYDGTFIVRIEDTNPDNICQEGYDGIPRDANWLTNNGVDEVMIQSERLELYYKYAEQLINLGHAYVCTCAQDVFKKLIEAGEPCPCRNLPPKENLARWKKMFKGYNEGDAVLRVKTEINHKNPAMRDWPAARINDTPHLKTGKKYRVWPLMNLSVVVDDIESGMTHIIRGKDHMDNAKKQEYVYRYLNKTIPETKFIGRINFIGDIEVSCSKTKRAIDEGKFAGWNDIRLPFLEPLRRRGYQPEAFLKYAEEIGPSQNDKTVTIEDFFKAITAYNKEIIDPKSNRYFFIAEPEHVTIKNSPKRKVEILLHPEKETGEKRTFNAEDEFYLSKDDLKQLKSDKIYRLMDCLNFKKTKSGFEFLSQDYEDYKTKGEMIMHWLPKDEKLVHAEVLMPDAKVVRGIAEHSVSKMKIGDICQFERFGFCRLDSKEGDLHKFWFTHK